MHDEAITENEGSVVESPTLEEPDYSQLDEPFPDPQPISYFGSDFDVEGLVRRLDRGDVVIPSFGHGDESVEAAGFQRDFVWRKPQMDRFVESLLLGYPVPGIFLVQQRDKRYLVLDGHQRLRTLAHFYEGTIAGRVFSLQYVADALKDLTYRTLDEPQRRTLDNTFIQAIIVRTDGTPATLESVYRIFERLNAGGTQLTPHEIRVALYAGPLVDFIVGLSRDPYWRKLYGPPSPRLRDQELVLRIVGLYVAPGTYKRPLKKFLNDFAASHRSCENLNAAQVSKYFTASCEHLWLGPGRTAFRYASSQVNVAMTEAVMVGLMRRLEAGPAPSGERLAAAITELERDKAFGEAVTRATADEDNVRTRIARATQVIASA